MRIKHVEIELIKDREKSQRQGHRGVDSLIESIKRIGLIHPIVLQEDNTLVVGANRLEAFKRMGMKKIPAVYMKDLDEEQTKLVELDENMRRNNLVWQEQARATRDIAGILLRKNPEWKTADIAAYMGYADRYIDDLIRVANALDAGVSYVVKASGLGAAISALQRESRRRGDDAVNKMWEVIQDNAQVKVDDNGNDTGQPLATTDLPSSSQPKPRPKGREIMHMDFAEWARGYSGKRFNLLHCDFPYGINHGKSGQGGAKEWGAYEDSPDVYWHLLRALCEHRDKILYPSAHIIFWFSMKFYHETLEFFRTHAPDFEVDYQPLVWFKTDNKGIVRDAKHAPRNVTETAFFITRDRREIVKSVGNCIGAATHKARGTHISEKPVTVVKHFMQLCCDSYSEVLDPTCGSGSALRAAHDLGAARIVGMDINEEYAKVAQKQLDEHRKLEEFSKQLHGGE